MIVILMGVSGVGKTTLGRLLAARLGWPFLDADDFHPPANVEKMKHGHPLTDADREPWLAALVAALREKLAHGESAVLACSALKKAYRDRLRLDPSVRFVMLKADPEVIRQRLAQRSGHFFPPDLLASQLEALEEPHHALEVDATDAPEVVVPRILEGLGLGRQDHGALRIASVGHAVFGATLIALGILGLVTRDLAPIWQFVPEDLPGREALGILCAVVSLACGLGLFWRRAAAGAARVLFGYLFLWMLLFKARFIAMAPAEEGSYQTTGETAVIVAGAWVLFAWFAADWDRRWVGFAVGDKGVRLARALYALALIAFGLSHFVYLQLTAPLVPRWLPGPVFWAYLTGACFLAAGAAVLSDVWARLAAALSAVQIGLFTVLVWGPILAAGHVSAQHWAESVVSWTLTAGAWVVADSYRGIPWLAVGRRASSTTAAAESHIVRP